MPIDMGAIRDAAAFSKSEGLIGKLREDGVEFFIRDGYICWPEDSLHKEEIAMVHELLPYIVALLVIEEAKNIR